MVELPGFLVSTGALAIIASTLVLCLLLAYGVWRRRNTPAERERRRRLKVNASGRITDGTLVDLHPVDGDEDSGTSNLIQYIYTIGGVDYSAAQDISTLLDHIDGDPSRFVGPVHVKYHTKNRFNSIVVCEDWSGLRESDS